MTRRFSGVSILPVVMIPNVALISCSHSIRKYHSTASNVPKWSATSKASPGSSQPNNQGARAKWPELLIGRNSERPWMMPSAIAWSGVMICRLGVMFGKGIRTW